MCYVKCRRPATAVCMAQSSLVPAEKSRAGCRGGSVQPLLLESRVEDPEPWRGFTCFYMTNAHTGHNTREERVTATRPQPGHLRL